MEDRGSRPPLPVLACRCCRSGLFIRILIMDFLKETRNSFHKCFRVLVMLYSNQFLFFYTFPSCLSKVEEEKPPLLLWASLHWFHIFLFTTCTGATRSVSTACPPTLTLASHPATSQKPRLTLRALDLSPTLGKQNQTRSKTVIKLQWHTVRLIPLPRSHTPLFCSHTHRPQPPRHTRLNQFHVLFPEKFVKNVAKILQR